MSDVAGPVLAGVAIGAGVGVAILFLRLAGPPASLMRTNVDGLPVPAVLGDSVIVGSLIALGVLALTSVAGWGGARTGRVGAAIALLVAVMGAAGRVDDLRGDETVRGFGGHLGAARAGRITGGFVKIVAGVLAGLGAGALVTGGADILVTGAVVALAANLFNLLDRAPGRAVKLWLVAMIPVLVAGPGVGAVASAGMIGAAVAVLPADLGARGMLGDAGANPLGAVWGLGLALALPMPWTAAAAAVLLALNLISERFSFSAVIERTAPLRAFDRLGRK
jgi:UDP-GlcNAc:undecaprenyl-phosphate/decaprenyl-phosphate GlcNAc-1-phosphate transferase